MSNKKSISTEIANSYSVQNTSIYIGKNWKPISYSDTWAGLAISDTGKYATAVSNNGPIYISNDYSSSWNVINLIHKWSSVEMSVNGQYQVACVFGGLIFLSSNYGVTWDVQLTPVKNWINVSISGDGLTIYAIVI